MQSSARQIRKLRVSAKNEADARHAALLLEDAFNSASFPGVPNSRLLLIKKIQLGNISVDDSSLTLSQKIDHTILSIVSSAVLVDYDEHPDASAVWFSNKATPYFRLIELLSVGDIPTAWYWKNAVSQWKGEPLRDCASSLFSGLGGTERNSSIFISLLMHLGEKKCLVPFVELHLIS